MSALPPKADMCAATRHVRFGPKADIAGDFRGIHFAQPITRNRRRRLARQVNRATQTVSGCCCCNFWHGLISSPAIRPVIPRRALCPPYAARGSFEQRRAPMRKSPVLTALILAAIAFVPRQAAAVPISEGAAHSLCKGWWTYNMDIGTSNCAYCERPAGKPICHFFACDQFGCDYVIVDRKRPKGPWRHPTPVLPGTLR
jgi:hypothetical protein